MGIPNVKDGIGTIMIISSIIDSVMNSASFYAINDLFTLFNLRSSAKLSCKKTVISGRQER